MTDIGTNQSEYGDLIIGISETNNIMVSLNSTNSSNNLESYELESDSNKVINDSEDIPCMLSLNSTNDSIKVEPTNPIEIELLQSMFRLQVKDVYKTEECKNLMNYLRKMSSSDITEPGFFDISNVVDNDNCMEFLRNYITNISEHKEHMLENISQRQYINFIKFVMALWNLSDKSDFLCARMAAFKIHTYLIRLLGQIYGSQRLLISKQIQLLVMSIVGILHNINDKLLYTRSLYRDENLVFYLMPLASLDITKDLIGLKTAALLLLAFLVNENENSSLNANDDHIIYILDILKSTLNSCKLYSKYYGYHCLEILHSLRHIASPDTNKQSLIKNGVLSFIEIVIQPGYEDTFQKELIAGLELLWSLSFSNECLTVLNNIECNLKSRVKILAQNSNTNIVLSARGILWNIDAQRTLSIKNLIVYDAKTPNINGHVMISYQHSTQDIMIKIKDALILRDYKVWMDVDHMRGSFVDAMAEGIQHASVLLLGMCQAFKNSPHCRQEVKYAYTLGIPLVTVMLEQGFSPDGWLGLMCATLTHTEFFESSKFPDGILQLEKQLGSRGKSSYRPLSVQDSFDSISNAANSLNSRHCQNDLIGLQESLSSHQMNPDVLDSASNALVSLKSDHSSSFNFGNQLKSSYDLPKKNEGLFRINSNFSIIGCDICSQNNEKVSLGTRSRFQVLDWTTSQCKEWLTEHCLNPDNHGYPFTHLDGPLLFELAEMRLTAPKSYFITVKEELKLNFIDNLHLNRALRALDVFP